MARHTKRPTKDGQSRSKSQRARKTGAIPGRSDVPTLKQMLLQMPNVGEDRDFERIQDQDRGHRNSGRIT